MLSPLFPEELFTLVGRRYLDDQFPHKPIERILEINHLQTVTKEVVEKARERLVLGSSRQ